MMVGAYTFSPLVRLIKTSRRSLPRLFLEMLFESHDGRFALFLHLLSGHVRWMVNSHKAAAITLHEPDRLAVALTHHDNMHLCTQDEATQCRSREAARPDERPILYLAFGMTWPSRFY